MSIHVDKTANIDFNSYLGDGSIPNSQKSKLGIFGFGFATNPIENKQKTQKEELLEKLSRIKNPETRKQIEKSLLYGTPSQEFVDYLIKKYNKKQAEFEEAWAEYQASKDNLKFYKKTFEVIEKKYENTDSNYEMSLVTKADKDMTTAERNSDILLSKASDIAHRVVG